MGIGNVIYAKPENREELARIWQVCFGELPEVLDVFFSTYFEPRNCLVYVIDEQVVAMVHLLPSHIAHESALIQAHYIYAAATLPEYRSQGYMGELLAQAAEEGVARGDKYSILLPSEPTLYSYYGRQGYHEYFKMRFVALSYGELQAMAASSLALPILHGANIISALRYEQVSPHKGSVIWSQQAIEYAIKVNDLYKGKLICSETNGRPAYALCSAPRDSGDCEILEIAADQDAIKDLLAAILQELPANRYTFRLPGFSPFFPERGKVASFGMIKPLLPESKLSLREFDTPYLGLTLD